MTARTIAILLTAAFLAAPALADQPDLVPVARKVRQANEKAVITILATLKMSAEGANISGGNEKHMEAAATVIDASGLCVTSSGSLDPVSMMGSVRANVGGTIKRVKLKGELNDVKMRLADGTELPARVVLKDDDLDLAFVAPMQPPSKDDLAKFATVSLADAAKPLDILDSFIEIGRLGKDLNYQATARIARVTAMLSNPRTFYLGASSVGCPAFDAAAKCVGIIVIHRRDNSSHDSAEETSHTPVILPAGDIVDLVAQAKEEMAKPAATTKPATKP